MITDHDYMVITDRQRLKDAYRLIGEVVYIPDRGLNYLLIERKRDVLASLKALTKIWDIELEKLQNEEAAE